MCEIEFNIDFDGPIGRETWDYFKRSKEAMYVEA